MHGLAQLKTASLVSQQAVQVPVVSARVQAAAGSQRVTIDDVHFMHSLRAAAAAAAALLLQLPVCLPQVMVVGEHPLDWPAAPGG